MTNSICQLLGIGRYSLLKFVKDLLCRVPGFLLLRPRKLTDDLDLPEQFYPKPSRSIAAHVSLAIFHPFHFTIAFLVSSCFGFFTSPYFYRAPFSSPLLPASSPH